MAEKKIETVTITIPYIEGKGETEYVNDNGKAYLIRKGEPVDVPVSVAEILEQSNRQAMVVRNVKKQMKEQNLGEM
ncbi:MAG: hypothetical protein MJZ12_01695 [Prevotella sp.]|nr:hypothetical protein [Prevotella sp.]